MKSIVDKLEIFGMMYRFSLKLDVMVSKFDRRYKFNLGDRIIIAEEKAEELAILANRETDHLVAARHVYDLLTQLDIIEVKLRKAAAFGLINDRQKGLADIDIDNIRGKAKGWRSYFLRKGRSTGDEAAGGEPF